MSDRRKFNVEKGINPIRKQVSDRPARQVPEPDVRALYADLGTEQRVFVHVACAAHQLVWENQHMILLRASAEWPREGTFADQSTGSFFVDPEGNVHPE